MREMRGRPWTLLALLACVSGEYLMGGHLDNNARSKTRSGKTDGSSTSERKTRLDDLDLDLVAAESTVAAVAAAGGEALTGDDGDVPRYHIPYPFAFNGGKPFSLEKDPITGKIDFEKAPPVKALNYTGRYRERGDKESKDGGGDNGGDEEGAYAEQEKTRNKDRNDAGPNEINAQTPNFHDFLNLPVHYSSTDKYGNDKYPLISSSYANTKVQSGANSYSTYNHRPYHPESELHVHSVHRNPYTPITKTSTHRTTTASDFNARWTSTTSPSTTMTSALPSTANSSHTVLPTSTQPPIVTTWKPPGTPITFHSIDRAEENEKNLLPIEKLHASVGSHRNPSDVSTQSSSDGTTTTVTSRYKDQSNLNNFVVSHAKPEMKPEAQNEEHKDSYDTYESDGESDADNEDNYYFFSFGDLLKEDPPPSTPSTTTSSTTISTTTASTTTTTVAASPAETTTSTTAVPSRPPVSPTLPTLKKDVPSNRPLQFLTMPQHPIVPLSSLSNDRRPGITEHYDGVISHGYRPSPIIKSEPDRIGAGAVVESTSNIVIPPDQDTVSFVLGNRQNVDGGYYSVGTAVGENPYGGGLSETDALFWPLRNDPHDPTKEVKHEHMPVSVVEPNPDRVTQKWVWPSSPSPPRGSNEVDLTRLQSPLIAVAGTVVHDTKNPNKEKDSGHVIFPDDETRNKDALTEEHIVIINEADGSIRELPPKTTLTATSNKTKLNPPMDDIIGDLPQLAEDLVPPVESSKPSSHYYHYQFDTSRPNHSRPPQRLPLPPRVKPHSGPPVPPPLDVRKRPYSPDQKLPNILPQFRPNAKASHGHRGPDVIGTMPAGQGAPTRIRQPLPARQPSRRPMLPAPSYLQRLNPPPPPIHAVRLAFTPTSKVDSVVLPHETEPTIRRLRPPHGVPPVSRGGGLEENAPSNRLFAHGDGSDGEIGENRKEDRGKSEIIADERENEGSERYPEEPPMTPPRPPLFPKRRTADPPHVTTLQMIQHHGEFGDVGDDEAQPPVEPMLAHEADRRKSDNHDPSEIPEQPVYVVYPVNTAVNIHPDDSNEKDGSVVVGTRGPQRPLPPDTLLQNEDDTHTVYNGRPVALDFPYPLERPDPSSVFPTVKETPVLIPSEQRQQAAAIANERENEKNEAVNVIPYLQDFLPYRKKNDAAISVTLHRTASIASSSSSMSTASTSTSTPIAYVYTPTYAPYPAHLDEDLDGNDDVTSIDAKQTVLLPSQQPSSSSSSAPAPQNFMAPFVASMSAETPSKNGWSVVVVEPPAGAERKSDSDSEAKPADSENDAQTERSEFDADNFKPQLFGGFKPLYEFPSENAERHDVADADAEINMPRHSKELLPVPDKG
ncbi:PREDICTED: uncharacterized protein LOC105450977 [Wasmannia auropunctata]|uniref:uncharacterized protein LOC105450977 n=1 Tax=Wasmannia auropunctata TaxID=64793 RepID=UPI0005EF8832|nr:PREDICTED: uncharacterized protein LOC105450977 [Wasmannia auropunctata]